MSRRVVVLVAVAMLAGVKGAGAQGLGYGIAGAMLISGVHTPPPAVHGAVGGELLIGRRAGIGAEAGILGNQGGAQKIWSVNGVLHFGSRHLQTGASPYVSGGFTRLSSGEGTFDAWNAGGGVDIWIKRRVGVRLDVRDHIRADRRGNTHYLSARGGLVLR